jgi:MFS family permease
VLASIYLRNPAPVEQTADSIGGFFKDVIASLNAVMKIFHVWLCALICAVLFGSLLAGGVVWTPKLMAVRGASPEQAAFSASLLWLGLAAGCLVLPAWSDRLRRRKLPIVLGCAIQLACASAILYVPVLPIWLALLLNFIFGFANAAHMLTFSSAADVVPPQLIGTSAAFVNGLAFIAGGIMIARPGARVAMGEAEGLAEHSLALAQYAALPIVVALAVALLLSLIMRESYPKQQ